MSATPTSEHHEVVVVGSRCAGAATAMLLARQGVDVVAVDRASFPSDTLSTHAIARSGVVQLERWGLMEEVVASGAAPIRQVSFHVDRQVISKQIKRSAGVDFLVAPRRSVMDEVLFRAAADAGADMRTGITVAGVRRDAEGRVDGITGHLADGSPVEIRARLVVGADGLRSRVGRTVGAEITDGRHANGACFYTYVSGLEFAGTEFHLGDGGLAGLFPTHYGEANVWVSLPARDAEPLRGPGRERHFRELLARIAPAFAERVAAAEQTAPVRGFAGMPNQLRRAAGPGWALVGDAGYFRDAITGHGMTDAFRDAEMLARAVGAALRGEVDDDTALARYHRRRDAMVAELFDIATALALYPPVPVFTALQKRLSRCIEAEAEFLAALPPVMTVDARAA
jgi:2-polyprenyl-6-methoxyphenol hydroxylase-like FAD-dependent oxidoreductase